MTIAGAGRLGIGRRLAQIFTITLWGLCGVIVPMTVALMRGDRERYLRVLGGALARSAERLGPVFIKLAQMVSYRSDLFPQSVLEPLARLQEQATPLAPGEARRTLRQALNRPLEDVFARFDDAPLACGSIASIHLAQLPAGDRLAIKIVRPEAPRMIRRDIACFRWIASRIASTRLAAGMPVREIFDAFAEMLVAQCDMTGEARNLEHFARVLAPDLHVHVPSARADVAATTTVLAMDYVGETVSIASSALPEAKFRRATLHVLRQLYHMIFVDGVVHGDLHPGNVHVMADGAVCLFDAGLVARLSPADRECFRDFFIAIATGSIVMATSAIIRSALSAPADLDRRRLEADVARLVQRNTEVKAGEFLVVRFVQEVFAVQRHHGLYGVPGFASAIWALVMFEGLVRDRYPDLDFQGEARSYATTALLRGARPVTGSG